MPQIPVAAREDGVVNSIKGCREIEENQDRGEGGCLSSLQGLFDSEECSLC